MKNLNRVVAVAAAFVSLALAVMPVVLNFDWTSTAGCVAGIIAILGIVQKWLDGWQRHEERLWITANPHLVAPPSRSEVVPIVLNNRTEAPVSIDEEDGDPVHPLAQNYEESDPANIPPDRGNPQAAADAGGAS